MLTLNPGVLFKAHGLNSSHTPVDPYDTRAEIRAKHARQRVRSDSDLPESPPAQVYDVSNSSTTMVILNNRRPKASNRLRGYSSTKLPRSANPDRHSTDKSPRKNQERHEHCTDSSSPRFQRPGSQLPGVSTKEKTPARSSGTRPKSTSDLEPATLHSLGFFQQPRLQRPRTQTSPPRMLSESRHIFRELRPGERAYLSGIAKVYSMDSMIKKKQWQYKDLLLKQYMLGFYTRAEYERYSRYIDGPRKSMYKRPGDGDKHKEAGRSAAPEKTKSTRDGPRATVRQRRLASEKEEAKQSRKEETEEESLNPEVMDEENGAISRQSSLVEKDADEDSCPSPMSKTSSRKTSSSSVRSPRPESANDFNDSNEKSGTLSRQSSAEEQDSEKESRTSQKSRTSSRKSSSSSEQRPRPESANEFNDSNERSGTLSRQSSAEEQDSEKESRTSQTSRTSSRKSSSSSEQSPRPAFANQINNNNEKSGTLGRQSSADEQDSEKDCRTSQISRTSSRKSSISSVRSSRVESSKELNGNGVNSDKPNKSNNHVQQKRLDTPAKGKKRKEDKTNENDTSKQKSSSGNGQGGSERPETRNSSKSQSGKLSKKSVDKGSCPTPAPRSLSRKHSGSSATSSTTESLKEVASQDASPQKRAKSAKSKRRKESSLDSSRTLAKGKETKDNRSEKSGKVTPKLDDGNSSVPDQNNDKDGVQSADKKEHLSGNTSPRDMEFLRMVTKEAEEKDERNRKDNKDAKDTDDKNRDSLTGVKDESSPTNQQPSIEVTQEEKAVTETPPHSKAEQRSVSQQQDKDGNDQGGQRGEDLHSNGDDGDGKADAGQTENSIEEHDHPREEEHQLEPQRAGSLMGNTDLQITDGDNEPEQNEEEEEEEDSGDTDNLSLHSVESLDRSTDSRRGREGVTRPKSRLGNKPRKDNMVREEQPRVPSYMSLAGEAGEDKDVAANTDSSQSSGAPSLGGVETFLTQSADDKSHTNSNAEETPAQRREDQDNMEQIEDRQQEEEAKASIQLDESEKKQIPSYKQESSTEDNDNERPVSDVKVVVDNEPPVSDVKVVVTLADAKSNEDKQNNGNIALKETDLRTGITDEEDGKKFDTEEHGTDSTKVLYSDEALDDINGNAEDQGTVEADPKELALDEPKEKSNTKQVQDYNQVTEENNQTTEDRENSHKSDGKLTLYFSGQTDPPRNETEEKAIIQDGNVNFEQLLETHGESEDNSQRIADDQKSNTDHQGRIPSKTDPGTLDGSEKADSNDRNSTEASIKDNIKSQQNYQQDLDSLGQDTATITQGDSSPIMPDNDQSQSRESITTNSEQISAPLRDAESESESKTVPSFDEEGLEEPLHNSFPSHEIQSGSKEISSSVGSVTPSVDDHRLREPKDSGQPTDHSDKDTVDTSPRAEQPNTSPSESNSHTPEDTPDITPGGGITPVDNDMSVANGQSDTNKSNDISSEETNEINTNTTDNNMDNSEKVLSSNEEVSSSVNDPPPTSKGASQLKPETPQTFETNSQSNQETSSVELPDEVKTSQIGDNDKKAVSGSETEGSNISQAEDSSGPQDIIQNGQVAIDAFNGHLSEKENTDI